MRRKTIGFFRRSIPDCVECGHKMRMGKGKEANGSHGDLMTFRCGCGQVAYAELSYRLTFGDKPA